MTFCKNCGNPLEPGATKCGACGTAVGTPPPPTSSAIQNTPAADLLQTRIGSVGGASSETFHTSADATVRLGATAMGGQVGRVLGGRYQLDQVIGSGGMGEIYRARRLHIGDTVAVKVLRPDAIENDTSRQRFYREARAAALLKHPNAVVIHDFGEDNDGTAYIVMELLEGRSLRQLLAAEGTMAPVRAAAIIRQACAALDAGHRNGIIHRDIKPDNIILLDSRDDEDHIKILDFGIAKVIEKGLDTASLEQRLTNVGAVIGTPHYMSPEQCQGEEADARSDIYSLGVVIYELLTGVAPFLAKTPTGVAIKQVTEKPRPPREIQPSIGEAVQGVVLKALAKNPDERPQTAIELSREFEAALRQDDPQALGRRTGEHPVTGAIDAKELERTVVLSHTAQTPVALPVVAEATPPLPQSFETMLTPATSATDQIASPATTEHRTASADLKTQTIDQVGASPEQTELLKSKQTTPQRPEQQTEVLPQGKAAQTELVTPATSAPVKGKTDALRTDPFPPELKAAQATELLDSPPVAPAPTPAAPAKEARKEAKKPAPAKPAPSAPKVEAAAPRTATPAPVAAKSRAPLFIGGGVAALVLAGLAFWMLSGNRAPDTTSTAVVAPTVANATPATATPAVSGLKSDFPELPAPDGMVYVLGGPLRIGRDDGEENERPAHLVEVAPFFIDRYEVTNEQYQQFIDATGRAAPPAWKSNRHPEGAEKLPVTDVTWEDATEYAKWRGHRLPTEEEWEFAARGPEGRLFPWGGSIAPDTANVTAAGEKREIVPVGQFIHGASPFGVVDLVGNVWEWTASDYAAYPGGTAKAPAGYSNLKVIRGGSFETEAAQATATLRRGWPAARRNWPKGAAPNYAQTGFRMAQDFKK